MSMNKILKYVSLLVVVMLIFGSHAQTWQQHLEDGKRFYKNGDYENAYYAFQKAQTLSPNSNELNAYLAQSAYRAGKFQEAAEAYQRDKDYNDDTWSSYNQGNAKFRNNDMNGAIDSYKEALRKNPNNEMARYNLAYAKKKQQEQQNQDNNENSHNQQDNEQNQNNENQQKPDKNQDQRNQQPQEGNNQPKLGREQTEQLLESMNQADKKAQEKLKDKEKALGSGKREKDW
jgi:Ca-activated chloride channel homolog